MELGDEFTGARGQVIFALAPFIGAVLAWPVNGDQLTTTTVVAFAVSLSGVLIVATSHHSRRHVHEVLEHAHPIDVDDPHHRPGAIALLAGNWRCEPSRTRWRPNTSPERSALAGRGH